MSDYYDSLETRSHDERATAQLAALRAQLVHARDHTSAYAADFAGIDVEAINDFESFTRIPLTRKSELIAEIIKAIIAMDKSEEKN